MNFIARNSGKDARDAAMYAGLPIQDWWFSLNPLAGIVFITFGMLICVILCDCAHMLYMQQQVRAINLYMQQQHRVLVRETRASRARDGTSRVTVA